MNKKYSQRLAIGVIAIVVIGVAVFVNKGQNQKGALILSPYRNCNVATPPRGCVGALSVARSPSSPSGSVLAPGDTGATLAVFQVSADNVENLEIDRVWLDFSNGSNNTFTSNATGYMDCQNSALCDLTGNITIFDPTVGWSQGTTVATNPDVWNGSTSAQLRFPMMIFRGTTREIRIVGNISSGVGAENVHADIVKFSYRGARTTQAYRESRGAMGNVVSVALPKF